MNAPTAGIEYLHAEAFLVDGKWQEFTLTISAVADPGSLKAADGKAIDKYVLSFKQTDKRMICGKLNKRLASYAIGTGKTENWPGKSVTLYAAAGNWFGQQNVAAIRIRIPEGTAKPFLKAANLGRDLTGTDQVTNFSESHD